MCECVSKSTCSSWILNNTFKMGFDFNPQFWYICRLCKEAFPSTDKLKYHKLENHLGDCLRINCIVFEEQFRDCGWCPNQDLNGESFPQTTSKNQDRNSSFHFPVRKFQNPYVPIKQLTAAQLGAALRTNSTAKNGFDSSPSKRKKRSSTASPLNPRKKLGPTKKIHQRQVETYEIQEEKLSFGELVIPKEEPDEDLITGIHSEIEAPIPLFLNPDENHHYGDNSLVLEDEEFIVASFETCVDSSVDLNSEKDQFPDQLQELEVYSPRSEVGLGTEDDPLTFEEAVQNIKENSIEVEQQSELETHSESNNRTEDSGKIVKNNQSKKPKRKRKGVQLKPRNKRKKPRREPIQVSDTETSSLDNYFDDDHDLDPQVNLSLKKKASHKPVKSYSCTMCEKSYKNNPSLKTHMLNHTKQKPWKCTSDPQNCHLTFKEKFLLKRHIKRIHTDICKYKCPIPECGETFRYAATFQTHIRKHEEKLCASTCGDAPCVHKEAAAKLAKFQCLECRVSFKSNPPLKKHMIIVHGKETEFKCTVCGQCFVQKAILENHERMHRGEQLTFKCNVANCDSVFSTKPNLDLHLKTKHVGELGLGKFLCQLCGRPFAYERFLKLHIKFKHEDYKPFKCTFEDSCPEKFQKKWQLTEHVRVAHTGEMPFQCDKCGKSYARKQPFVIHLKLHEGYVRKTYFDCSLCPRKFRQKEAFLVHVKSHERGTSFSCRFCDYQTCYKPVFTKHERSHMKKKDDDEIDLDLGKMTGS